MIAKRVFKISLIVLSVFFILVFLCIIFISPITKYLIEKYDKKYTGREISLGWVYVNPFTGYIYLNGVKVYEQNSDSVFLDATSLSANFKVCKLFSKEYEITGITISDPVATVIQNGNKHSFNFDDIIAKFSSSDKDTTKPPVHFTISHFTINNGEFHYLENIIPINYFIKKVHIECDGIRWNNDTINSRFTFIQGIGSGDIKGSLSMNKNSLDYKLSTTVKKLDLNLIEQY
ncbi:MAG: DUF748 domain-containing protein, partial [Bacteroidia bacterium]